MCMYVCIHVCVHVCVCALLTKFDRENYPTNSLCMCIYTKALCMYMNVCVSIRTHAVYMYIYACIEMYIHTRANKSVYRKLSLARTHTLSHSHIHTYIHTYIKTNLHISEHVVPERVNHNTMDFLSNTHGVYIHTHTRLHIHSHA